MIKKDLKNINIGIIAGFVSGITIWAYQYMIDIGYPVWLAVLICVVVFLMLYLPLLNKKTKK